MKAAVVGAGICGLSAARSLAQRGHQVELFEQFDLFHDRGSSHGRSRIVRKAYPDAFYTACMAQAYPIWHELESDSGRQLLHECGLLYFGSSDAPAIQGVAAGLSEVGVPFEILQQNAVKRLLPELRLSAEEVAIWTAEAGWVDAALALRTLYDLAIEHGTTVVPQQQVDPLTLASRYDVVIVAAGAWTTRYAALPVEVTLQTYAYVDAQIAGPVWIEDSSDMCYGFPSDDYGLKMGVHRAGTPTDPGDPERTPDPTFLEIIEETALNRFGIKEPRLNEPKGCLYTTTRNEDFLMGRLAPNVFFASACSGHGFKMGPWVGKLLADFAEGIDSPERHPRFHWAGGTLQQ